MTHINYISADKILLSKEFSNFIEAAKNFCLFIEKQDNYNAKEFLVLTQTHLLTLYQLGRTIPDVGLQSNINVGIDIPNIEMKATLALIGNRVPFSYYASVLNPLDIDSIEGVGIGDLIDDLGDIFEDLKRGIILFDKDDVGAKENAVWKFKFDYDNHSGEHCIEALYAIHHYLYGNK